MRRILTSTTTILAVLSLSQLASACDMHGAGYGGHGLNNAPWETYNPKASKIDPAFADIVDLLSPMPDRAAPPPKAKPSFSNVANLAAARARANLVKKEDIEKADPKTEAKKTALNLNSDR